MAGLTGNQIQDNTLEPRDLDGASAAGFRAKIGAVAAPECTSLILPSFPWSVSAEGTDPLAVKAGLARLFNPIRASALAFEIAQGAGSGSTVQFGIYDASRALIIQSGPLDGSQSGRVQWNFTERVFALGDAFFAWTFSTSTGQMRCANLQQGQALFSSGPRTHGVVANAATATAMPATLGAFTSAPFVGGWPLCQLYKP